VPEETDGIQQPCEIHLRVWW